MQNIMQISRCDRSANIFRVLSNQSALNANSGALIVSGGVGIGKNLYVKDEII